MLSVSHAYERLTESFLNWAATRDDIRAALILGSRARVDHPADDSSDLDLVLFAVDPSALLFDAEWLRHLGQVWLTFVEPTAVKNGYERRVLFHGDLDVDFSVLPSDGLSVLLEGDLPPEVALILRRGWRALVDRDGHLDRLRAKHLPAIDARHPNQSMFDETVSDFLYHALWARKKLERGELWTAKLCCDGHMKTCLLRLLEWQARATHGVGYDTWHNGRFLEEWAEPRLLRGLATAFARYDASDIARALVATTELFLECAHDVAAVLSLAVHTAAARHILGLLQLPAAR